MKSTKPARVPLYRLHKPSGLAVVRLYGKDTYLGDFGKPESKAEYRRVIAEWLAACGLSESGGIAHRSGTRSVNELVLGYLDFAKPYYVKNGRPTSEVGNVNDAVKPLTRTHGAVLVAVAVTDCSGTIPARRH